MTKIVKLQSKSIMLYVTKNFLHFLPLVVLSTLMLTFFLPPFGPIQFFNRLFELVSNNPKVVFDDFHESIYQFFSFVSVGLEDFYGINAIWLWIITLIVALLGMCMMFSFVERHIKYGTRRYERLLFALNETFLSVVPFTLLVVVFYEIWVLLLSGLIVLASVLFSGMTFYVISVVLTVVFYIVFFILLSLSLLTPPCMFFDGYKFGSAIGYSFQLVNVHFKEMVSTVLLNVAISMTLFAIYNFLTDLVTNPTVWMVMYYVGRFLFYLWWMIFLPCISCCKYVDYTETTRADLKLKIF